MNRRKNIFALVTALLFFCLTGTAQSSSNPVAELRSYVNHQIKSLRKDNRMATREAYRVARKYGYVKVLRKIEKIRKAQLASVTPIHKLKIHINSKAELRKYRKQEILSAAKEESPHQ